MKNQHTDRIVFVDYIRVIACFLVMLVHSSENFYGADASGLAGNVSMLANDANRFWVSHYDGFFGRISVPLFMIVSAFLLVPVKKEMTMKDFYKRSPFTGHQPEIAYAMADNPLDPYEYKGVILDPVSSGTNHHSIVEYKGQWYMFYHTSDLSLSRQLQEGRKPGLCRSICVDSLFYNPDGTIQKVIPTVNKEKLK